MSEAFTPNVNELVAYNAEQTGSFHDAELQVEPVRKLAIVTCMDSRVDPFDILGIANGDAHIIRNAGGVITDDVIRSLCLSQRSLGTREIILMHHTDCGLQKVDEASFRDKLETELGVRPPWSLETFSDASVDVAQSINRLLVSPFLPHKDHISGFVYDVDDGSLHRVDSDA